MLLCSCSVFRVLCRRIAAPADHTTTAAAAAPSTPVSPGGDPIVHLVIRKSAKLDWQLAGSRVELAISAGASAGRLAEHAEAVAGVQSSAGSRLQLLYNGEVLPAGRALSSFGIPQGAVLDLVSFPLVRSVAPWSTVAFGLQARVASLGTQFLTECAEPYGR